jgi:NADPH2:quinone reductase
MPEAIRAVVVDPSNPEGLAVKPVELAPAGRNEATVRVTAISLNRGEVRRALSQVRPGGRPGWDFAGIVEQGAADGSGPAAGSRVVGLLPSGAWAERLRVPSEMVATLPAAVTDTQAATLPVAGLTALYALRQGGLLLGRKVLVDGASGGVGHLACQLATASGAELYGQFRSVLAEWCGEERIVLGPDLRAAAASGPFYLILDSVGGPALAAALTMLAPGGVCVHFGVSGGGSTSFESRDFFTTGGVKLYGLALFHELRRREPACEGLALLAGLVANRILRPHIAIEASWAEIGAIARRLIDRAFAGKAVLHIE